MGSRKDLIKESDNGQKEELLHLHCLMIHVKTYWKTSPTRESIPNGIIPQEQQLATSIRIKKLTKMLS